MFSRHLVEINHVFVPSDSWLLSTATFLLPGNRLQRQKGRSNFASFTISFDPGHMEVHGSGRGIVDFSGRIHQPFFILCLAQQILPNLET